MRTLPAGLLEPGDVVDMTTEDGFATDYYYRVRAIEKMEGLFGKPVSGGEVSLYLSIYSPGLKKYDVRLKDGVIFRCPYGQHVSVVMQHNPQEEN